MSYIDAFLERDKDRINVVERVDGKRYYKTSNGYNNTYNQITIRRITIISVTLISLRV